MNFSIAINSFISAYKYFKGKHTERVLKELQDGLINQQEAGNKSDDIYRFSLFLESLERASTYEKANALKDLYMSTANDITCSDDLYFEIFSILSELSDREMKLLYCLEEFLKEKDLQKFHNEEYEKCLKEANSLAYSDLFYCFASHVMRISPDLVSALMHRLARTGLIETTGLNANATYQEYQHTALYREIKSQILLAIESPLITDTLRITANS